MTQIQSLRPQLAKLLTPEELSLYDRVLPAYTPQARFILDTLLIEALQNICMPFQPNPARNIALARALRQAGITVAGKDTFRFMWEWVDPQKGFTQPFTYLKKVGNGFEPRYVLIREWESTYNLLPHMLPYVEWVAFADFSPENYTNVTGGHLSVPNSWNDTRNMLVFGYIMFRFITQFVISGDAHGKKSFWSRHQWVARRDDRVSGQIIGPDYNVRKGEYPRMLTTFRPADVYHPVHNPTGLWQATRDQDEAYDYVVQIYETQLKEIADGLKGSKMEIIPHTIWYEHCNRGFDATNTEGVLLELADLHAHTRDSDTIDVFKGQGQGDQFGIYAPQVLRPNDPFSFVNVAGLERQQYFDAVAVSGQALFNCIIRTLEQEVNFVVRHAPDQVRKLAALAGTSSAIPGTETIGNQILDRLTRLGMRYEHYVDFAHWLLEQVGH